jgi:HEPN domain-containing protein
MLKEIDPEGVVKSISVLASESKRLAMHYEAAARTNSPGMEYTEDCAVMCRDAARGIGESAKALGMAGIRQPVTRLTCWLEEAGKAGFLTLGYIKQLGDGLNAVVQQFGDQLDDYKLFQIAPAYARYYSPAEPLFGEAVRDAFPIASDDIEEAGKAYALGLSTACVFHLMRAAEGAAAVILKRLGGEPLKDDGEMKAFGGLALDIEEQIEKMPRGPKKDAWMKLKTFMSAANRGIRTKVAHPGSIYGDAKAESLMEITKGFLQDAEELLR